MATANEVSQHSLKARHSREGRAAAFRSPKVSVVQHHSNAAALTVGVIVQAASTPRSTSARAPSHRRRPVPAKFDRGERAVTVFDLVRHARR